MIYGTERWNDVSIRYDQENNIIENFLKKIRAAGSVAFSLESCNVESCACAVEAVDGEFTVDLPVVGTKPIMGYGDLMFDYLNSPFTDPKNEHLNRPETIPPNEIMENLGYAIDRMTNCKSKVHYFRERDMEEMIVEMIQKLQINSALVCSYLTDYGTGHYITVVAYDTSKRILYGYDPWGLNLHCRKGGVLEEYDDSFIKKRFRPRFLEVWKN